MNASSQSSGNRLTPSSRKWLDSSTLSLVILRPSYMVATPAQQFIYFQF